MTSRFIQQALEFNEAHMSSIQAGVKKFQKVITICDRGSKTVFHHETDTVSSCNMVLFMRYENPDFTVDITR